MSDGAIEHLHIIAPFPLGQTCTPRSNPGTAELLHPVVGPCQHNSVGPFGEKSNDETDDKALTEISPAEGRSLGQNC